jgi:hypothetical protein
VDERERFLRMWSSLDSDRRREIRALLIEGKSTPDPHTAWLVCSYARWDLRRRWMAYLMMLLPPVVWTATRRRWLTVLAGVLAAPVTLWTIMAIRTCGRAIRVNGRIAQPPADEEEG